jgi:Polyketide cyclase / dehydrase and lipid transport
MSDILNFDPPKEPGPEPDIDPALRRSIAGRRIAGAFGIALLFALAAFALASVIPREGQAFASISFLFIAPAALCAFIAYVADPMREKPYRNYAAVPMILTFLAVLLGAIFLREGVVCILMLSPIWIGSGLLGVSAVYSLRKRLDEPNKVNASVMLILPLIAMQLEAMLPVPVSHEQVSSAIVIDAPAEQVWPHLLSIPAIRADEGQWNLSQDVIGIPRPSHAQVIDTAQGLVRKAEWGPNARFDEVITGLEPGRAIQWRFHFPDDSIRQYTDAHIDPAGHIFRIETGGYRIEPLSGGKTRLVLETNYRMHTPMAGYAAWWGEFYLSDIQDNVLTIIKDRVEI